MTYEEWNGSEEHRPLPETFWKARLNSQQWEAVRLPAMGSRTIH